jgi:2-phosphosulfolactate phosphatase
LGGEAARRLIRRLALTQCPNIMGSAGSPLNVVDVRHGLGIDGARSATGVVVVIDVMRAFTLSAYALAGGARECLLVPTVEEARELAAATPGSIVSAEVDGLPVPGIAISNSPTQITQTDVRGRAVIQRTSAGTPVINAVSEGLPIYAGSLVVARATAQACLLRHADTVTLVASGDFPEDHACAGYIEGILKQQPIALLHLLRPLFESDRYRRLERGDWPGFPKTDLELALTPDRFDFAMPVTRQRNHMRLIKEALFASSSP